MSKQTLLVDKLKAGTQSIRFTEQAATDLKKWLSENGHEKVETFGDLFHLLLQTAGKSSVDTANTAENSEVNDSGLQQQITQLKTENELLAASATRKAERLNEFYSAVLLPHGSYANTLEETHANALAAIEALKSQTPATEITFDIFSDPRLKGFDAFRKEEHQHPFDTLQYLKTEADRCIIEYEALKFTLEQQPFQLLEPEEYAWLRAWDEETFMPAMRALTGIPDLVLTARQKYMLMLDYVQADPVAEFKQLVPGLPPEQLHSLEDMQFPRASAVQQVLADIEEKKTIKNETLELAKAAEAERQSTGDGAKIIDINRTANDTAADTTPAAGTEQSAEPGTDGPE